MEKNTNIAVFEGQQIRHIEFEGEVFYNLVDVMNVLDASTDPAKYWFKVKKKMLDTEGVSELSPIWRKLPFVAANNIFFKERWNDTRLKSSKLIN